MTDLLARLESAGEGSRELDAEIARVLGHKTVFRFGDWERSATEDGKFCYWEALPSYTTNLQNALVLVPEGWDVWFVSRQRQISCGKFTHEPKISAEVMNAEERVERGEASTPALAMCIASLRAIEARAEKPVAADGEGET